jgi:hypothetical protein
VYFDLKLSNHLIEMLPLLRCQLDAPVQNAHARRLLLVVVVKHFSILACNDVTNALEGVSEINFDQDWQQCRSCAAK